MLIRGDSRFLPLRDGCVDCVVTSPPYWGLRDYGHGDQIGLEATPDAYVGHLVQVFREVRRVLKDSGVVWCNLGDSYAAGKCGRDDNSPTDRARFDTYGHGGGIKLQTTGNNGRARPVPSGLKPKDLVGVPWRVAFALQADGWYLRSDVIWAKPNPMPESVTDRPTKAHEMLFLLTKSERYFYDAAAISERVSDPSVIEGADGDGQGSTLRDDFGFKSAPPASLLKVGISLAASVLNIAQRQNNLGLFAFDAEVGQQGANRGAGFPVVHIPVVRRAAAHATRFTDGDVSAKEFLEEMHGLCIALPDGDDLKETWRLAALDVGHIHADSDRSVAVNNAGKVGEIKRVHDPNYTARVPSSRTKAAHTPRNDGDRWQCAPLQKGAGGGRGVAPRGLGRNRRTVWTIPTMPYAGAHFATMPEKLIEPCILAGCPMGGLVLDPFVGSGTVVSVAQRLGRRGVGVDLSYQGLAKKRTAQRGLSFGAEVSVKGR
jgi:DNA modification methylase